MTVYRVKQFMTVWVDALQRDVALDPAVELNDIYPEDAAVIAEWAGRGLVRAPNVEAATSAPGEARSTRRSRTAD